MKRRADEKGHLLRRTLIALAVVLAVGVCLFALKEYRRANAAVAAQAADGGIVMLPLEIDSGRWNYGHCQGIAVDGKREYIYYSFTTALIKTDLEGNVVGTVTGLLGHLGCIAFNEEDGRVYGSLEYKNDAIGRGILDKVGHEEAVQDAFYIAAFDVEKIDRRDMDACADGVMTCVYLREVVEDYLAEVACKGKTVQHRYGCSGIDGITFAPMPGSTDAKKYLFVSYGVYSDLERDDNDNQVLLCYDTDGWAQYEQRLSQQNMHKSGPEKPDEKLFVYTGNTTYGVQNLEYDAATGNLLMAVYKGKKPGFENKPMYIVDGHVAPKVGEDGLKHLQLVPSPSGIGWDYAYGSTGLASLGDGLFYVSYEGKAGDQYYTKVRLCRYNGTDPLELVK